VFSYSVSKEDIVLTIAPLSSLLDSSNNNNIINNEKKNVGAAAAAAAAARDVPNVSIVHAADGTVRVFGMNLHDAIGSHACSLQGV
jgi:hypothetical protein